MLKLLFFHLLQLKFKSQSLIPLSLQHIVEYDLLESLRGTLGLVTCFTKRIFQSVVPVSMTLVLNRRAGELQILIADNEMKFRVFDRNTFEILATYLGPIYDTYVGQMVSRKLYFVYSYSRAAVRPIHFLTDKTNHFSSPFLPPLFIIFISSPLSTAQSTQVSISHQNFSSFRQTKIFAASLCRSMEILFEVWAALVIRKPSESSGSMGAVSSPLDARAIRL